LRPLNRFTVKANLEHSLAAIWKCGGYRKTPRTRVKPGRVANCSRLGRDAVY
jgi:hypothetical protein